MGSLTAHLRRTDDHGGLPFHPECPLCRSERLSGTLPAYGPLGRRTQAAILVALLAGSTAIPTVAVAQEADQVTEGVVPEASGGDSSVRPEFDPGGADEGLQVDEPTAAAPDLAPAPDVGDPGPLESEPVGDSDVPVVDEVVPAPAATPAPSSAPPVLQHLEQSSTPAAKAPELVARIKEKSEPATRNARPAPAAVSTASEARATSKPQPAATSGASVTSRVSGSSARYHVVGPGESLWSIARDVLGSDATPARTAREVDRLWTINSARIATGDPDLLRVGTKLALR